VSDNKESPMVRSASADALGSISALPRITVPALLKALQQKEKVGVRFAAARALGEFYSVKERQNPRAAELRALLKDSREALVAASRETKNSKLAQMAKEALAKIK